jgi:L-ascorbate metabolism protein UlaG (beta-lactamase superfamily)
MEITYIGHSCFKIKGKQLTLVIDPYDPAQMGFKLPKLECDVLLMSHDHFDHGYKQGATGYKLAIDGPGEYEASDTFIYGIETFHDDKDGKERGKNTMYVIEIDGFTILHLGDLGHELSKETLEKIPDVNVLLIPVGGKYTIDAEVAAKVISSIEPNIVVPMHYSTSDSKLKDELAKVDKFLDEMGVEGDVKKTDKLKLTGKSDIPVDTEVVLLEPQH